jgi:hypothetical protein
MDRLNIDQSIVDALRTQVSQVGPYIGKSTPLPGTALKLDDDVMWLDVLPMRVLWGYEMDEYFHAYCPDMDLDGYSYFDGIYVTDRAPVDSQETPMPIYPQQAQQPQGKMKHDPKRALQSLLKRLAPDAAKRVRQLVKARRPELLEGAP